jgi:N-acetylmuramoyl-L-alanine amidase
MTTHVVAQGECLATIAARHGFEWQTIYNAPENAALRRRRPNPNILYPGDVVEIPEKRPVESRVATGRQHTFKVPRQTWELRLRLKDHDHEAISGVAWSLSVEGIADPFEGKTGKDGLVAVPFPVHSRRAILTVFGQSHVLDIGGLDPVSRVSGVQQRLARLGYDPRAIDGVLGPRTRAAIMAFQESQDDLADTGRLDDATRQRLQEMCDEDGREVEMEDDASAEDGPVADGHDDVADPEEGLLRPHEHDGDDEGGSQ